jgi:predicted phosphodiesterase
LDHFLKYEEEIFFIGHTHYPMKINHKGKTIINPGSVGQQRNGVLGAHWGIFDLEDETFEFKLTPYDVNEVERQVEEIDPDNSYLRLVLRRKR